MQYIGKLDKNKIGKYKDRIITSDVILTDERKEHIYKDHTKDFELIINNISKVILNPKVVIEDVKNKDTIFLVSEIENNNLNVIVKLNTINSKKHPLNSIMTAWIIRDSNLRKIKEKNKIIYKRE